MVLLAHTSSYAPAAVPCAQELTSRTDVHKSICTHGGTCEHIQRQACDTSNARAHGCSTHGTRMPLGYHAARPPCTWRHSVLRSRKVRCAVVGNVLQREVNDRIVQREVQAYGKASGGVVYREYQPITDRVLLP